MAAWWHDFVGGVVGGSAGIFVGHPLDTIKLQLQTGQRAGVADAVRAAASTGGLWKGMLSPLLGNVPIQATLFGTYGSTLRWLEGGQVSDTPQLSSVVLAGQAAGLVQLVAMCPTEHFKILVQQQAAGGTPVGRAAYTGSIDCAIDIWRGHGLRGVYKGVWACFVRDVGICSYGMYYGVYEVVRQRLLVAPEGGATRQIHPLKTIAAGAACGLVSWSWCYPFDVIKSKVQATPFSVEAVTPIGRVAKVIWQTQGWRGFFAGYSVMAVRSVPSNAATFFGYELTMSFLNGDDDK